MCVHACMYILIYRNMCVEIYVYIQIHMCMCVDIYMHTIYNVSTCLHTYDYNALLYLRIINTGCWYKIPAFIKFTQTFTHLLIRQLTYSTNIY